MAPHILPRGFNVQSSPSTLLIIVPLAIIFGMALLCCCARASIVRSGAHPPDSAPPTYPAWIRPTTIQTDGSLPSTRTNPDQMDRAARLAAREPVVRRQSEDVPPPPPFEQISEPPPAYVPAQK